MASTRTLQTAANALRLGAYRSGVASSSSLLLLLRSTTRAAVRQSAPAPRHAPAALPSGIRRYSQQQAGESKIWSFEEVHCALAPLASHPANPGPQWRQDRQTGIGGGTQGNYGQREADRLADEIPFRTQIQKLTQESKPNVIVVGTERIPPFFPTLLRVDIEIPPPLA